jgi:hypothetical protein
LTDSLFLSAASFWEICIKKSLGKFSLKNGWLKTIQDEIKLNAIQWLPVEIPHCAELTKLPFKRNERIVKLMHYKLTQPQDMCSQTSPEYFIWWRGPSATS